VRGRTASAAAGALEARRRWSRPDTSVCSGHGETPYMALHPAVTERLARLAPDQRTAATAHPGPILCVAPAGSGKTTTLIARIAWLIASGVDPASIAAITFNRRAAEELSERLSAALAPLGVVSGSVRVRTFHALGLEILRQAGLPVRPLVDRMALLREVAPQVGPAGWRLLDTLISRMKLDLGLTADMVAADEQAGPIARAFVAYERAVAATGGLDFDDLVVRSLPVLETDESVLAAWRHRCSHLLVDEVQDVDRSQLRLALLLAAPANRIFLVGDDDQSIYGWRLADVRRVLDLAGSLSGLRRIDLVTNYRCPKPVVERAVRLVAVNHERFAKRIKPRSGAAGRLILAPDGRDDAVRLRRVLLAFGPEDGTTRAILARTNRELLPAAAAALELGVPFRASGLTLLVESPLVDELIAAAPRDRPPLVALAVIAEERRILGTATPHEDSDDPLGDRLTIARALLAWCAPYRDLAALVAAVAETRARLAELRRDDAALSLATAHGTKGLEFDHVAVIGLEEGRFPSARALGDAPEPERALEEERRLAYVAWTRARRTLTLVYDPAAPSRFLVEAFSASELGLPAPTVLNRPGAGVAR
jgi:superfamily I DNA/RNA helicase